MDILSVIYSDKELKQIERLLGEGFIELYEKLWAERNSVKNYLMIVKRNFDSERSAFPPGSGGPHSKTYWEYKLGEIGAVLRNQNEWLGKVMEPLKGKISDDMYSRLEKYIDENEAESENDPRYMLSQIERLTWEGHQLRMALIAGGADMDEVREMTNNEAWMATKDPTVPDEGAHRIMLEKKEGY